MTDTTTDDAMALAKTRRERGIVSSILHAEDDARGWADSAFAALCMYSAMQGDKPFTIEAFRSHAVKEMGLALPPELRAFGGITLRALHHGVLRRVGFAAASSSNGSPKPLYVGRKKVGRPRKIRGPDDPPARVRRPRGN